MMVFRAEWPHPAGRGSIWISARPMRDRPHNQAARYRDVMAGPSRAASPKKRQALTSTCRPEESGDDTPDERLPSLSPEWEGRNSVARPDYARIVPLVDEAPLRNSWPALPPSLVAAT